MHELLAPAYLSTSDGPKETASFMRAIARNPGDNLPRLVFADALEEHGGPLLTGWAELIRAGCEAGNPRHFAEANGHLSEEERWQRYVALHRLMEEKKQQLWQAVGKEASGYRDDCDRGIFFRDFYIEPPSDQAVDTEALRAAYKDELKQVADLACASGELPAVRSPVEGLQFLQAPWPEQLTALDFSRIYLDAAGIRELAQCHQLSSLTFLDLHDNNLQAAGIRELAQCHQLSNLTSLDLSRNLLDAAGITELAQCPQLSNLTSLNLCWNGLQATGIRELAQCHQFSNLTSLDLSGNYLDAAAITELAQCHQLSNLTALDLSYNDLDAAGIRELVQCHQLSNLTSLNLSCNYLDAAAIRELVQCHQLSNLTSLELSLHYLNAADIISTVCRTVVENGVERELFPHLTHIESGNPEVNQQIMGALTSWRRDYYAEKPGTQVEGSQFSRRETQPDLAV